MATPPPDMLASTGLLSERLDEMAEALVLTGWWCADDIIAPELQQSLRQEVQALVQADSLARAGVGREGDFQIDRSVRRDRIHWLRRESAAQDQFLTLAEQMRQALNRRLFLGLFEFETHFAHYPPGAFYRRHVDSFRGAANRVLSTVNYLNHAWGDGDGGELMLYAENSDETLARITPVGGRMVIFLSEELPHEVLPARRDRYSIAGWFRLNASIQGQIDPPR